MSSNLYVLLLVFLCSSLTGQAVNEDLKPYRLSFQPKKETKMAPDFFARFHFMKDSLTGIYLAQLSDNALFEQEYIKFKAHNQSQPLAVYELLIYFGTHRLKAGEVMNQLTELKKPYEKSMITYEQPNYRVKLGRYYSKLKAYARLKELQETYPGISLVRSTYIVKWDEFKAR